MESSERIEVGGVQYVRAYPVAKGRCPHCGLEIRRWTAERVLHALRAFADRFGHPPTSTDLQAPGDEFPRTRTVATIFGSWDGALRAAGLPMYRYPQLWTDEQIIDAMLDWAAIHGTSPRAIDWLSASPAHPTSTLVSRRFGSWNTAIRKAGFRARGASGAYVDPPHRVKKADDQLVDAAPIAHALRDREGGSLAGLAELARVHRTYLEKIRSGETTHIRESYADRIAIALDRPDIVDSELVAA